LYLIKLKTILRPATVQRPRLFETLKSACLVSRMYMCVEASERQPPCLWMSGSDIPHAAASVSPPIEGYAGHRVKDLARSLSVAWKTILVLESRSFVVS